MNRPTIKVTANPFISRRFLSMGKNIRYAGPTQIFFTEGCYLPAFHSQFLKSGKKSAVVNNLSNDVRHYTLTVSIRFANDHLLSTTRSKHSMIIHVGSMSVRYRSIDVKRYSLTVRKESSSISEHSISVSAYSSVARNHFITAIGHSKPFEEQSSMVINHSMKFNRHSIAVSNSSRFVSEYPNVLSGHSGEFNIRQLLNVQQHKF